MNTKKSHQKPTSTQNKNYYLHFNPFETGFERSKQTKKHTAKSFSFSLSLSYNLISIHSFSDEERSQKMAKNYFPCFTIYFVYV